MKKLIDKKKPFFVWAIAATVLFQSGTTYATNLIARKDVEQLRRATQELERAVQQGTILSRQELQDQETKLANLANNLALKSLSFNLLGSIILDATTFDRELEQAQSAGTLQTEEIEQAEARLKRELARIAQPIRQAIEALRERLRDAREGIKEQFEVLWEKISQLTQQKWTPGQQASVQARIDGQIKVLFAQAWEIIDSLENKPWAADEKQEAGLRLSALHAAVVTDPFGGGWVAPTGMGAPIEQEEEQEEFELVTPGPEVIELGPDKPLTAPAQQPEEELPLPIVTEQKPPRPTRPKPTRPSPQRFARHLARVQRTETADQLLNAKQQAQAVLENVRQRNPQLAEKLSLQLRKKTVRRAQQLFRTHYEPAWKKLIQEIRRAMTNPFVTELENLRGENLEQNLQKIITDVAKLNVKKAATFRQELQQIKNELEQRKREIERERVGAPEEPFA